MPFNIFSYIQRLQQSLDGLALQARVAFAVWCADALYREARDYLAVKCDPLQYSIVREALDYLWKYASGEKPAEAVDRLLQACAAIDWTDEGVTENERTMNFYATEAVSSLCCALDVCATGSALSAAKTAEGVINKLDWQLSDELFVRSYSEPIWSDPKWKAELESQQKMLDFLRETPSLRPEQNALFR